uniref:Calcipressin-2 n=1 Tax=Soboliphyme baturini TaxID=241478 RepID=A0A183J2C7_9BILA
LSSIFNQNTHVILSAHGRRHDHSAIKIKAETDEYLKIPELQKQFLISPPASPPVGWEQCRENQPGFDFELLARLAGLNSAEVMNEVVPMNENYPAIKVFPCREDGDTILKPKIKATRRPDS